MNAITSYIRGSIEELHHVRWPTRQQSVRLTLIVLGFILVSAIFVGIVDAIFTEVTRLLLA